jgi:hypothetical protein
MVNLFLHFTRKEVIFQVKEPNDYQVSILLANLSGYRSSMFTHQLALDMSVKTLVQTYKDPIKQGLAIIKTILAQCIHECCSVQVKTMFEIDLC